MATTNSWHVFGDIQRFGVAIAFVIGFLYLVYQAGELLKRIDTSLLQGTDVNNIMLIIVTSAMSVAGTVAGNYFGAKTSEKATA